MSQDTDRYERQPDDTGHWYVSTDMIERIVTENGGEGTTPDDAERFVEDFGVSDSLLALTWLKIETFRTRIGLVLDTMEQYVAGNSSVSLEDMVENCHTILGEYMELCEVIGVAETRNILICHIEDD